MVAHFWHSLILALMALSLLMGCASSPYVGTGALLGGGLGTLTGAAIGSAARNPWAGAIIGGAVGTGLGAAGGYALQQRQAQPQGYYPPSGPGYGYNAPAPRPYGYNGPAGPGYSYNGPPPGPSYGGAYGGYNTPNPVTPPAQYSEAPPQYSQAPPQASSVHTPIGPAPYYTNE